METKTTAARRQSGERAGSDELPDVRVGCAFCSGYATGIDEDGEYTCGDAETCEPVAAPLPAVIEQSDADDESDEVSS